MKAAVVTEIGRSPEYAEFADPVATRANEEVVDVLAAGLHPLVRSRAAGAHYSSTGELPLVPGVDGVGRGADGRMRYFILPGSTLGAMAERTVIDRRRSVELPEGADPVRIAAAMNPGMSSWIALRRRISMSPGAHVLVLGATGNAGRMAVPIAKLLGAGRVTAIGRGGVARLDGLGADDVVDLDGPPAEVSDRLGAAGSEADVVLDYLWGEPAAQALTAIIPARTDDSRPLRWIQIGSIAGATSAIPSAALRASRLEILGSGHGSVSTRDIVAELADLAAAITDGTVEVDARPVPLADVATAWAEAGAGSERLVLVP